MNEKNMLLAMMACMSIIFIATLCAMLKWRISRPSVFTKIYETSSSFIRLKSYKYLLVGTYFLPMIAPYNLMWFRFSLMTLFFALVLPLGIRLVIGKVIKKADENDKENANVDKLNKSKG